MADLIPKERLQPSLLDRLTDEEPAARREAPDRRVLSWQRLRESVLRDLGFLFNCVHLAAVRDLSDYPYVERSTLNYGIPDLSGRSGSTIDPATLARTVRRAIVEFEPRLLPGSLKVTVVVDPEKHNPNALRFDMEAELWAQPLPLKLYLRSELNLEDGEARVTET